MVYPETHAAGAGARKASMDLLEVADEKGYNIDICSYARTNLGYMELLKPVSYTHLDVYKRQGQYKAPSAVKSFSFAHIISFQEFRLFILKNITMF